MGIASTLYALVDTRIFTSIGRNALFPLVYAIFISSALCYGLLSLGNKHLSSSLVTAFWPVQILTSVTLSYLLLGVVMTAGQGLGGILILAGLVSVTLSDHQKNQTSREGRS